MVVVLPWGDAPGRENLEHWVARQNLEHRVAPTYASSFKKYAALCREAPCPFQPRMPRSERRKRAWALRFSKVRGLRIGNVLS